MTTMKMKFANSYLFRLSTFGLLALASFQFLIFQSIISEPCSRQTTDDAPLIIKSTTTTSSSRSGDENDGGLFDEASACLLICDDNHFLIEWLAYHYHVINLRTLIITSDPKSRTSPKHILKRWKNKMNIEYWEESSFLDPAGIGDVERSSSLKMHRYRQRSFNTACLRELKRRDKSWVIISDTDEFVTLNPKMRDNTKSKLFTPGLSSIRKSGSVMDFLTNLTIPSPKFQAFTPCVPITRIQFSSRDSSQEEIQNLVPSNFHGSDFLTLRWRKYGTVKRHFRTIMGERCSIVRRAGPVKTIIDLSRMKLQDLYHKDIDGNPHKPLESICSKYDTFASEESVGLIIFHYLGTLSQWSYRVTDNRGAGYRLARYKDMNDLIGIHETDEAREWLAGFVETVGTKEASRLLQGVGKLEHISNSSSLIFTGRQEAPAYKVGDIVLAQWDGGWYWAQITTVFDGGFYNVIFIEDCGEDLGVGTDRIKKNTYDISKLNMKSKMNYAELLQKAAEARSDSNFSIGFESS